MSLPPLTIKFLKGAQKVISVGGFAAQVQRTTSGGPNPADPLGPDLEPTVDTKSCMVFVDMPKTRYFQGGLTTLGDGYLYLDLLSVEGNSLDEITWTLQNGDVIIRPDGRKLTVSDAEAPEALGFAAVSQGVVTYNV